MKVTGDEPSTDPARPALGRPEILQFVLIVFFGTLLLSAVIVFYDNVHRGTTNGLWKSGKVAQWVDRTPGRQTEPGNLVYFPVEGLLVRCLPAELFGPVWRRMAFVNAFFGAAALGATYLLARRLFSPPIVAIYTIIFQSACAFFLMLATINEDIMPGYAWFIAAVTVAVLTAHRPSWLALFLTAQLLAISWLFHSSLQLPGICAFLLAILARAEPWAAKVRQSAFFLLCLIPLPVVCALAWGLNWNQGLWAGKGLGTGWGGFALNKVVFMWSGIGQYFVGGLNEASMVKILQPSYVFWMSIKWLGLIALGVILFRECRRQFHRPEWRTVAALLGGAFIFGEGMNLYIQPQDPQMQIQPMAWLPIAGGCLCCLWLRRSQAGTIPTARHTLVIAGVLGLLAVNIMAYLGKRHQDSKALQNLQTMEGMSRPQETMFLFHGFEGMSTWFTIIWGAGATWPNSPGSSPNHERNFKVIYVVGEATVYPNRSAAESAQSVALSIQKALAGGFRVIADDIWSDSEQTWVSKFSSVSGPEKPRAICQALHAEFEGKPLGFIPGWGPFYSISKRAAPVVP